MELLDLKSLSIQSIPERTARLLFVSSKLPMRSGLNLFAQKNNVKKFAENEPSTIYNNFIIKTPEYTDLVPKPDYYPNYIDLTPEQKWIYLNWLQNILSPIDIGYVFLYYYGLERHLMFGNFDLAFDEILDLRKHHKNSSFTFYSSNALMYSCIIKNKPDRLVEFFNLLIPSEDKNIYLLTAFHLGKDLTFENIFDLGCSFKGINKRYLKSDPQLFRETFCKLFFERYLKGVFPLTTKYSIKEIPRRNELLFSNISFPQNKRYQQFPNFMIHEPFITEINSLYTETHEKVKIILKEKRNSKD